MTPLLLLLLACQSETPQLVASRASGHGQGVGGLSLHLRSDGEDGEDGEDCLSEDAVIEVYSRGPEDEDWQAAEVTVASDTDLVELALVADNSGSEEGFLPAIVEAVAGFGHAILDRESEDRAALVRVSTEASLLTGLSADGATWDTAVGELFIANGWTALWDGVRLGNEALQAGAPASTGGGVEFCLTQARRSVVVFTDGQENNSADEHETSYDGDGVDTTVDDLVSLSVLGIPTPIYTIGVGNEVDAESLEALSLETGGDYAAIEAYEGLSTALLSTAEGLESEVPVCFEVEDCSHDQAWIVVTDGEASYEAWLELPGLCGCTYTQGYWSTHEEAWPVDHLVLGGRSYTQAELLTLFDTPVRGDKSLSLAHQLIAARLNQASGADTSALGSALDDADAWLVEHDDGGGLPFDTSDWDGADVIKDALDDWNNGLSGPGHCD